MALGMAYPAWGHDVSGAYQLSRDGSAFVLEFFFDDGEPATDYVVTVRYGDGEQASLGRVDAQGVFRFRPSRRSACVVRAEGGGHGVELAIPEADIAAVMNAANTVATPVAGAVEVSPLRRQQPFPLIEVAASVGFVGLLTLITLILMRLAGRRSATVDPNQQSLLREVEELRAEVQRLRQERVEP
jgi:hypothetical protein